MNLAATTSGMISFVITTLILLLLLFFKDCRSVLQRLFFYLMVATNVNELGRSISIEHHFQYKGQEKVCLWIGFFYNWTGIIVFVFTVGIMIYLLCFINCLAKGNTIPRFLQPNCRRVALECMYVILPVLFICICLDALCQQQLWCSWCLVLD